MIVDHWGRHMVRLWLSLSQMHQSMSLSFEVGVRPSLKIGASFCLVLAFTFKVLLQGEKFLDWGSFRGLHNPTWSSYGSSVEVLIASAQLLTQLWNLGLFLLASMGVGGGVLTSIAFSRERENYCEGERLTWRKANIDWKREKDWQRERLIEGQRDWLRESETDRKK